MPCISISRTRCAARRQQLGVTLPELLVGLAIVSTLTTGAVTQLHALVQDNRLVAEVLEQRWNARLEALDTGSLDAILDKDPQGFLDYKARTGTTICGYEPIALLRAWSKTLAAITATMPINIVLALWIALAIASLPVPVSPWRKTVVIDATTLSASSKTLLMAGVVPTIPRRLNRFWISDISRMFSRSMFSACALTLP
mgnify:CR=1 FL=1